MVALGTRHLAGLGEGLFRPGVAGKLLLVLAAEVLAAEVQKARAAADDDSDDDDGDDDPPSEELQKHEYLKRVWRGVG